MFLIQFLRRRPGNGYIRAHPCLNNAYSQHQQSLNHSNSPLNTIQIPAITAISTVPRKAFNMQFFTLLAIPALAIAAAVPDPILARQVPGGLPALPLNPTCVTNCLTGVVACAPTNLASLTGLVGWYVFS